MNPATLALIVKAIEAAVKAAPQVADIVKSAKAFITSLFTGGLIDAATQDALHKHVDEIIASMAAGQEPPHWTVEPDPQ